MIAAKYRKVPFYIRKLSNFGIFNPSPKVANWNIILSFTGNGAGVAANTLIVINYKSILHFTSVQDSSVRVGAFELVFVCRIIKNPQQLLGVFENLLYVIKENPLIAISVRR